MKNVSIISEGKTKIVKRRKFKNSLVEDLVLIIHKDDITAGDGEKHDVIEGKAIFNNTTTCNVFELLQRNYIPSAFVRKETKVSFIAQQCEMIPLEVVVRRRAVGSYVKRNPEMNEFLFSSPMVEFFLKTSEEIWDGEKLGVDDPLMQFGDGIVNLFHPKIPISKQKPILSLTTYPLHDMGKVGYNIIRKIALKIFLIIESAWKKLGIELVDFKLEFGFNLSKKIVVADCITNDEWRIRKDGEDISKQTYRDGANIGKVKSIYQHVAELTNQF